MRESGIRFFWTAVQGPLRSQQGLREMRTGTSEEERADEASKGRMKGEEWVVQPESIEEAARRDATLSLIMSPEQEAGGTRCKCELKEGQQRGGH